MYVFFDALQLLFNVEQRAIQQHREIDGLEIKVGVDVEVAPRDVARLFVRDDFVDSKAREVRDVC